MQYSTDIKNARLNLIESTTGASPTLTIWSGSAPANTTVANSGTLLATMTLPADWMTAANNGVIEKIGTWEDTNAAANGVAGHFRIHDSNAVCHLQGTVAGQAPTDMIIYPVEVTAGDTITITNFSIYAGN